MIRLSMNELSTVRWTFERDVAEYAAAGYEGIGVWRIKLSDVGEERAIRLLEAHQLSVSNLMWAGGFTGNEGQSFRDSIHDAREAIRSAARIKADCLVLYSGGRGGHTRGHAWRLFHNALIELLPFAEEFNVTLAIEPMHPCCSGEWTFLNSIEETFEMLDPLDSPLLKLVLDTYHFGLSPEPDLELLASIVDRIAVVHLGDGHAVPCGEQDRCALGAGCVPLRSIIGTLHSAGYDGFLDVELFGESMELRDNAEVIAHSRAATCDLVAGCVSG